MDMANERRRATYEDLLRVPDHLVAEIIDGELFTSPRPGFPHARAANIISRLLGVLDPVGDTDEPGAWWIVSEPEVHLAGDVLVPDIAGWRRDRLPDFPTTAACTVAPDWVCEVLSKSTAGLDRVRKMAVYARERVGHLWLVDPLPRTLEVYRLDRGAWVVASTHTGNEVARAEPFEMLPLDMAGWWVKEPAPNPAPSVPSA